MPNPQLTNAQREQLFAPLFSLVKAELERLSAGDANLLWALRRKLTKELSYLERGTPMLRRTLKMKKRMEQMNLCPICNQRLPEKNAELDRIEATQGYTVANTRLLHHECHIADQAKKRYA